MCDSTQKNLVVEFETFLTHLSYDKLNQVIHKNVVIIKKLCCLEAYVTQPVLFFGCLG